MLQSIERYMKQAIVDKNHAVSSAALSSSLVSVTVRSSHSRRDLPWYPATAQLPAITVVWVSPPALQNHLYDVAYASERI